MDHALLCAQLRSLVAEDAHYIPLLANASALLNDALDDVNWVGFYLMRDGRLVLGPFQGRLACVHIDLNRGVCGAAARLDQTQRVPDVHAFPGHIACDAASRSEIVVPIHWDGRVCAVLDIDSPLPNRFTEADQAALEAVVGTLEQIVMFD